MVTATYIQKVLEMMSVVVVVSKLKRFIPKSPFVECIRIIK
jgi:hypothetical protein